MDILEKFRVKRLKEAKKDPFYQKCKREYQIPKPYKKYNSIILDVCMSAMDRQRLSNTEYNYRQFRPQFEAAKMAMLFSLNEPSVYCLYPKLLLAIEYTDLPSSFPGLEQSVPFGILLLPKEFKESGEETGVNYLVFSHFAPSDKYPRRENMDYRLVKPENRGNRSLLWFACTNSGTEYCEEVLIKEDGEIISKSDNEFISGLTSILIQSLYLIQEQTLVRESTSTRSNRQGHRPHGGQPGVTPGFRGGFSTKMPKTQVVRFPKHLGRDFETERRLAPRSKEVDYPRQRSSPIAHPRRGHRRIVHYGKGKKLQKTVWIQPTWVKSSDY